MVKKRSILCYKLTFFIICIMLKHKNNNNKRRRKAKVYEKEIFLTCIIFNDIVRDSSDTHEVLTTLFRAMNTRREDLQAGR